MNVRPLLPGDVKAAYAVMTAAFGDLRARMGKPPEPWPPLEKGRMRFDHFLETDPGGAWAAVDGHGDVVGAALALVREGLWGLSLLVVRPDAQSSGVGRQLLQESWAYGHGTRGAVILASADSRALRAYARLGLTLHPTVTATGRAKPTGVPDGVRPGGPDDWALAADVDRYVRGAARQPDMEALTRAPNSFLVLPDRGYAIVREGDVRLLAATDPEGARQLLRAAFAVAGDHDVTVEWITGAQHWAVEPCLDAGLKLDLNAGAVFVSGDVGPFTPYLPNGAYL